MNNPDEYKDSHKERGAGVDPVPEPDPNNDRSAQDLLEEAVGEAVNKVREDFTDKDDETDKDKPSRI
ncbi:hypothetical protein [Paenibacillus wulumuqiensis]|uniref:hypothetical protein n=1 Tax=Paenibacillus wulumuqiensis TaxID=1567107 RepID=UPI0006194E76|nr:hypothetical protein [Paenibacillus wulumuqiensis]